MNSANSSYYKDLTQNIKNSHFAFEQMKTFPNACFSSEYRFLSHDDHDCIRGNDLRHEPNVDDAEQCKEDCANDDDCGAVVFRDYNCWLKPSGCKDGLFSVDTGAITYLKENNLLSN